ncbi:TPA: DUF1642 domain-containing protein [Streptococcus suis]
MNKKEAIDYIKNMNHRVRSLEKIYKIISKIDQPQQVVVPAFIDSFIRYAKTEGMSLFIAMDNAQNKESEWIITNEDTFARARLDGYEVEKEQLYAVKLVGTGQYLVERYKRQGYVFIDTEDPLFFTKSELESAGFGGVFDSPLFEVEEVGR